MAARMKCDDKGDMRFFRCEHGEWWHYGMNALAVNKVPGACFDHGIDLWRNTEITCMRPGIDTDNAQAFALCLAWQMGEGALRHSGQERYIDASLGKASRHFMHMRFYAAHIREIVGGDHQQAKSPGRYGSHVALSSLFYSVPLLD